jgi:hypothetical protein
MLLGCTISRRARNAFINMGNVLNANSGEVRRQKWWDYLHRNSQ